MKNTYEIKRISSSTDKDTKEAIFLYASNIDPLQRTDTNEILYWLDNYNKRFEDKFFIIGLYQNKTLIGYAQLAYFILEKLLFVDYIVIDSRYRKNNTFYEFVEQIREWMFENSIDYYYIVGEVGYFNSSNEPTAYSKTIIRLLKISGFKVVKTRYIHPQLGVNHFESECQSVLMIYTDEESFFVKKETYFLILETIYFKHYQRWYNVFLKEKEIINYSIRLKHLFDESVEFNKKKSNIELNGYHSNLKSNKRIPENGNLKVVIKWLAILVLFGIFVVLFAIIHIFAKSKFNLDTSAQNNILFYSIATIFVVFSIFAEGKTNKVSKVIGKLIEKWK